MITANIWEAAGDYSLSHTLEGLGSWESFSDTLWITGRNWAEGLMYMDGLGHDAS